MLLGVHLTLLIGPTVAVPAPVMLTEALQRVEVSHSDEGQSGFQVTFQVGPQQAQLFGVLEQQLPRRGGPQGTTAHDEHGADLRLQRPQALRHRRLGDIEALGGPLKAPLLDDSGQAFQGCGVVGTHGAAGRVGTVLHYKCN